MNDARLLRFAAVLVVLAGYALVFRAGETRVAAQADDNARTVERIAAGERAPAARAAFERERERLERTLAAADVFAQRATLVARFVRESSAVAAARGSTIAAIAAAGGPPSGAAATPPAEDGFDALPLEMTVEGTYRAVLATIRALSSVRVLAAVELTSLVRKNAASPDATVTASLRVVLQRHAPFPSVSRDVHARRT